MNFDKILQTFNTNMTPEEIAAHDAEMDAIIKAQEEREAKERYRTSGAPERYWAESVDTYKAETEMQKKALNGAHAYIDAVKCGQFKSFVMIGNAGTGKTHLACGIVRACGGEYRTAPDIVEELRRAKSFNATETEAQILRHYGHVSLLVLDEIGRGINPTDEKYMLYQILNARYNTRRPTVLISNHTKAEFLQYIGVAAADRLVESGDILEMNGESFRLNLRAQK